MRFKYYFPAQEQVALKIILKTIGILQKTEIIWQVLDLTVK